MPGHKTMSEVMKRKRKLKSYRDDFDEDPMDYEELTRGDSINNQELDPDMLSYDTRERLKDDVAQTMRIQNLIREGKSEFYKYPYPDQGMRKASYESSTRRDPVAQKREIKYEKRKMMEEPAGALIKNMLGHLTQTTIRS